MEKKFIIACILFILISLAITFNQKEGFWWHQRQPNIHHINNRVNNHDQRLYWQQRMNNHQGNQIYNINTKVRDQTNVLNETRNGMGQIGENMFRLHMMQFSDREKQKNINDNNAIQFSIDASNINMLEKDVRQQYADQAEFKKNINDQKRDIFDISNNVYELKENDARQKNILEDIFKITKAFK